MALQKFNAAGGLTVGSNITVIDTTGAVTSTDITASGAFIGNGASISNLNASNLANGTVPADRLTGTYNISVSGSAASANSVAGNNVSGQVAFANVANNVAGANVSGPVANATFATTAGSATTATTAGTVTANAQPNITSVGTLTGLTVTAAINGSVTGSAATVTNASQPAITSLGTLTNLSVTNPINGNISGSAASATTAGTVTTAAQPNITSVGNLTSVTVTGNVTTSNIVASSGDLIIATTDASAGNGDITFNTPGDNRNINFFGVTNFNNDGFWNARTFFLEQGTFNTFFSVFAEDSFANSYVETKSRLFFTPLGAAANNFTLSTVNGATPALTVGFGATAANGNIGTTVLSIGATGTTTAPNVSVTNTLTTTNITTGANTTAGTLTGNWTLSAGSRLESTYADLGERYTSDVQYEAGTVVMFGGTHEVTVSTHEGRLKVAGVVSTQPAYVLNSTAPDSVVIALSGRVPCKVDCDVKRGDLLSVGHTPGHATVTEFVIPGAMVGKAISDSTDGIVEIQVWKS